LPLLLLLFLFGNSGYPFAAACFIVVYIFSKVLVVADVTDPHNQVRVVEAVTSPQAPSVDVDNPHSCASSVVLIKALLRFFCGATTCQCNL
jgi:hypothetical protein